MRLPSWHSCKATCLRLKACRNPRAVTLIVCHSASLTGRTYIRTAIWANICAHIRTRTRNRSHNVDDECQTHRC